MILKDLHMHTNYCDGKNTPEEMVLQAINLNMECVGICFHSYTFFDESYCIKKENIKNFKNEINYLKQKYKEKIKILCGVEMDFYSDMECDDFDYVIGSVHYIKFNDKYYSIDESKEDFINIAKKCYNNDFYKFAQDYFDTVSLVAEKLKPDIIGHFDLISKFNKENCLFDENDIRYISAYKKAIDKLVKFNIPFEINTGAISRGYKDIAYPSLDMLKYIYQKGGKVILSSDAHSKDSILFEFDKWENISKSIGFEIQ